MCKHVGSHNHSKRLESFRLAPHYDFSQPPLDGVLPYEKSGDALNGRRWRRLAEEALRALGMTIG